MKRDLQHTVSQLAIAVMAATAAFVSAPVYAGCPVHPHAQDSEAVCRHAYGRLLPNNTIAEWHAIAYWPISDAEETEGVLHLHDWLAGCGPKQPCVVPHVDPAVRVTQAFVYPLNLGEKTHNGIDYARPDGETFTVHAIADGRVVYVGYHPGPGHVVIIEHYPRNAPPFRSIYHHLRNGRDRDIALAARTKAFTENSGGTWEYNDAARAWQLAGEAAAWILDHPHENQAWVERQFGTNEQVLLVEEGSTVAAGQQIGWAGDTGIQSTGNHLHLMVARAASCGKAGVTYTKSNPPLVRWVLFDPYGLYGGHEDLYCYNDDDARRGLGQHRSIFAPAPEEFVSITQSVYDDALRYYATFSYLPSMLSIDSSASNGDGSPAPLFSGVFQFRPDRPVVRTLRTEKQHAADVEEWVDRGWQPDIVVVTPAADGTPLLSTVYGSVDRAREAHHRMTIPAFRHRFAELYTQGFVLTSLSGYTEDGRVLLSGSWELPDEFYSHYVEYALTREELDVKDRDYSGRGVHLAHVFKYRDPSNKLLYGAIWRQFPYNSEATHAVDLTAAETHQLIAARKAEGWVAEQVTTFEDATSVVFTRQQDGVQLLPTVSPAVRGQAEALLDAASTDGHLPVAGELSPKNTPTKQIPRDALAAIRPDSLDLIESLAVVDTIAPTATRSQADDPVSKPAVLLSRRQAATPASPLPRRAAAPGTKVALADDLQSAADDAKLGIKYPTDRSATGSTAAGTHLRLPAQTPQQVVGTAPPAEDSTSEAISAVADPKLSETPATATSLKELLPVSEEVARQSQPLQPLPTAKASQGQDTPLANRAKALERGHEPSTPLDPDWAAGAVAPIAAALKESPTLELERLVNGEAIAESAEGPLAKGGLGSLGVLLRASAVGGDDSRSAVSRQTRGAENRKDAFVVSNGAQPILIEGEKLAGSASVTSGNVKIDHVVQPGWKWRGYSQLLWSATAADDSMNVAVTVPAAGTYRVYATITTAIDGARLQVSHGGKTMGPVIDTYAAEQETVDLFLGTADFEQGRNELSITLDGHSEDSEGYSVGIDALRVVRQGS